MSPRRRQKRLERELRRLRSTPPRDLVTTIASSQAPLPRRGPRAGARVVFAGGLTAALLVGLGAVGGVGYAASSVQDAVSAVTHVFVPAAKRSLVSVSGFSAAGDQYRPGWGYGDRNHTHTGPPGLGYPRHGHAAPHVHTLAAGTNAVEVRTSIRPDEQVDLAISVVTAHGSPVGLARSRAGRQTAAARPTTVIRYRVLVPRLIPLRLRVPTSLLRAGASYRIKVVATSPLGATTTLLIPFRP